MNKLTKNILLTFDYELFLGSNSGTVLNSIIIPTEKLLKTLNKNNVKSIFFVDATYLLKLNQYSKNYKKCAVDYDLLSKQIQEIANNHYVYLHIHPHWLDAIYDVENNIWDLSNISKYTFSNLKKEDCSTLLYDSFNLLKHLIKDSINNKIEGYRAGGLFIQPFTIIKDFCLVNKIYFEFSVLPNFKSSTNMFSVDFSNVPNKKVYQFEENESIEILNGKFTEYTISEFSMKGLNRVLNSIFYRLNKNKINSKVYGDGKGATHILVNNAKKIGLNGTVNESFSVELMNRYKNVLYFQYLKNNNYVHFLSHPKLVSENNIAALDNFLKKAHADYYVVSDFKKIKFE